MNTFSHFSTKQIPTQLFVHASKCSELGIRLQRNFRNSQIQRLTLSILKPTVEIPDKVNIIKTQKIDSVNSMILDQSIPSNLPPPMLVRNPKNINYSIIGIILDNSEYQMDMLNPDLRQSKDDVEASLLSSTISLLVRTYYI